MRAEQRTARTPSARPAEALAALSSLIRAHGRRAPSSRRPRLALLGALAAAFFLIPAAGASADEYTQVGSFCEFGNFGGDGDGECRNPRARIAVDTTTDLVFYADPRNDRVKVFTPTDTGADFLLHIPTPAPLGIAVDPNTGDVYTTHDAHSGGGAGITKHNPDDQLDPTSYVADPGFTSPPPGSDPGEVGSFGTYTQGSTFTPTIAGIAVDPTTGDILVADNGNGLVQRFASDGGFVSAFDGLASGSSFTNIHDVAVDSTGRILVADKPAADPVRVLRFESDGTAPLVIGPVPSGGRVVLASRHFDDQILVGAPPVGFGSQVVHRFDAAGDPVDTFQVSGNANLTGLAVGAEPPFRLYAVTDTGTNTIRAFDSLSVPIPVIDPVAPEDIATPPGALPEVTFHGTVDPNGSSPTECRFEYVLQSDPDGFASAAVQSADCDPAPAALDPDGGPQAVTATATGLDPDESYQVRLFAAAVGLTATSDTELFDTPAVPPLLADPQASQLGDTSATLLATVNPANNEVDACEFQYVTAAQHASDGFDSAATAECVPGDPGDGTDPVQVSAQLEGLAPNTAHRFRLAASNGVEVDPDGDPGNTLATGPAAAFRTYPAVAFPARGYELVSAFDTANVGPGWDTAAADGDHYAYVHGQPVPGTESGWMAYFRASRNSDGTWTQEYMGLPAPPPGNPEQPPGRPLYSADLSRSVTSSASNLLDPDDQNDAGDAFLRTAGVPGVTWISRDPAIPVGEPQTEEGAASNVRHISPDGTRVIFGSSRELLPGHGSGRQLYQWDEGELSLVSVEPDAAAGFADSADLGSYSGPFGRLFNVSRNAVSPDGARVAFQSGDSTTGAVPRLFVRLTDAGETLEASASHPDVDPPVTSPTDVNYWGADKDTTQVFFTSTSQLTPDSDATNSPQGGPAGFFHADDRADLYRYVVPASGDPADGELTNLTPHPGGAAVFHVLRVSDDGRRVYFAANAALAPGASTTPGGCDRAGGTCNLYLAELSGPADPEPEITHVATARFRYDGGGATGVTERGRNVSADPAGRFLAFLSEDQLVPGRATGGAAGTGDTTAGSDVITNLAVADGAFLPGAVITGPGIPGTAGSNPTRITAADADAGTLTLTQSATATATGVALSSPAFAQAYLYDAERDSLACASCPADGSAPAGWAALVPASTGATALGAVQPQLFTDGTLVRAQNVSRPGFRNVTPAGSVFFQTLTPLLAGPDNERTDVFEYRAGRLDRITSGAGETHARFAEASADGRTVFFTVRDSLIPGVPARPGRLYAARVGGGAPPLALPDPPCTGEDCKPVATLQPADPSPPTGTITGSGNVAGECNRLQRAARGARQRARSLRQRARGLRQRAKRQARRGNAQRAKRLRRRANRRVGRRARSQRQRARRLAAQARECRQERAERGGER